MYYEFDIKLYIKQRENTGWKSVLPPDAQLRVYYIPLIPMVRVTIWNRISSPQVKILATALLYSALQTPPVNQALNTKT